ncbi:MAG: DinB family protein [Persicimonas sp.]
MSERQRLQALFMEHARHILRLAESLPRERWQDQPISGPATHLGNRVDKIHVENLLRHLAIAQDHFVASIAAADEEGAITPPPSMIAEASALDEWEARMAATAERITPIDLDKTVLFQERRYTAGGLLWAFVGHFAYHLGQIDLVIRQLGVEPPDYLAWAAPGEVVA